LIELHSIPASQSRIAGYRIGEDQSGGDGAILQLLTVRRALQGEWMRRIGVLTSFCVGRSVDLISVISDEMRAVVESEWPGLAHKLPPRKPQD
jgi:hypothetical protein